MFVALGQTLTAGEVTLADAAGAIVFQWLSHIGPSVAPNMQQWALTYGQRAVKAIHILVTSSHCCVVLVRRFLLAYLFRPVSRSHDFVL